MKNLLHVFLFILATQASGQAFITTWKTNNPGVSANNQITIPTTGTGYSYSIAWEKVGNAAVKGNIPGPITGDYTITFPSVGTYQVSITGDFPRIYFKEFVTGNNFVGDNNKILTVEQWGGIVWKSMAHAFADCTHLTIPARDAPNLTQVTDLSMMFYRAAEFDQPIDHWDVSQVTHMSRMFEGALVFNQPLGSWNVTSVTNMDRMFWYTTNFNQPLATWDVSNVTTMMDLSTC